MSSFTFFLTFLGNCYKKNNDTNINSTLCKIKYSEYNFYDINKRLLQAGLDGIDRIDN